MADGEIIIDTRINTDGVKKGVKEIDKQLDATKKSTSKLGDDLDGMFDRAGAGLKNIGLAIGAAFAVDKIIDFGKEAITAAGSATAMKAQFEQVFGDIQDQAQETIDKMADSFGMVSNRLKPAMSQMTSMFKGLGYDTSEAMGLAEKAVTASADAAAFYDKSFEDAQGSLQSFIKGNYEGGESIGLFANDTQMAAFAIKKGLVSSTTEWSKLDEATKQATRLEYATSMQELAGATGQAARESGGLENQLGNIKQAWQDFLAVVGEPLLALAIPILKGVTGALGGLADRLGTFFDDTGQRLEFLKDGFKGLGDPDALSGMDTVFYKIGEEFSFLGEDFENVKGALVRAVNGVKTSFEMTSPKIAAAIEPIKTAFATMWENIKPVIMYLVDTLYEYVIPAIQAFISYFIEHLPQIIEFLQPFFDVVTNIFSFIGNVIGFVVALLRGDWAQAWEFAKSAVENVVNIIKGIIKHIGNVISLIFGTIGTVITSTWNNIKTNTSAAWDFIKRAISDAIKAVYDNTIGKVVDMINFIIENWDTIKTKTAEKWDEIKESIVTVLNELPGKAYEAMVSMFDKIVQGIKDKAEGAYSAIKEFATNLLDKFKEKLGIKSPSTEMFDIAKNMIKGMINGLGGDELMNFIDNMIQNIKDAFSNGSFNLQAAIDFIGGGAMDWLQSIGIGGSDYGNLIAPVNGAITSDFGWRDPFMTDSGEMSSSYHAGIDIGAGYGTPVGAAGAGTVDYAGWYGGYGNTVMIDHGNGLTTMYAHLSQILVTVGDIVKQLEVIGLVGSTGNSTGAHLHFGVMQDGVWVDPSSIFGLATGTNKVPYTGLYLLHQNEAVVPEKYNPAVNDDMVKRLAAAVGAEQLRFGDSLNTSARSVTNAPGGRGYSDQLAKIAGQLDGLLEKDTTMVLDSGELIASTNRGYDKKLGVRNGLKARGLKV